MIVKQAQNQLGCLNCATRLFLVLWRARKKPRQMLQYDDPADARSSLIISDKTKIE
jgi:hypothetical protein